jgi:acyl-CoA synthetase (AMP-forming)/AMP-acid ligase II
MPKEFSGSKPVPFKTVGKLVEEGAQLPELEKLTWEKGQGKRQTAFLCYSSGTSGLPVCITLNLNRAL